MIRETATRCDQHKDLKPDKALPSTAAFSSRGLWQPKPHNLPKTMSKTHVHIWNECLTFGSGNRFVVDQRSKRHRRDSAPAGRAERLVAELSGSGGGSPGRAGSWSVPIRCGSRFGCFGV